MAKGMNFDLDQFKDLDLNDVGSWPVAVKVVAITALCAVLLGLGYWFDTSDQMEALDQARQKEQTLKEQFKKKQFRATNLEGYKSQLADIERSFGTMLRQLPSKTEVAELLVDISQAGLANGLEFELFKPRAEIPAEFYAELPIDVRVTGTYHDVGRFVSDVAALPRIVTLHDINIVAAGKDGQLKMSAVAKTYKYLEE